MIISSSLMACLGFTPRRLAAEPDLKRWQIRRVCGKCSEQWIAAFVVAVMFFLFFGNASGFPFVLWLRP